MIAVLDLLQYAKSRKERRYIEMKTKTLSFIKVLLVSAGILLICLPAFLGLGAYTYKVFIPMSVITISSGVIIPQLLLCFNAKRNKHLQKSACFLFALNSRFTPMYRLARLIVIGTGTADALSTAHVALGRSDNRLAR